MIKPLMQIPPTTKMISYDGKVRVMFSEMIEFEYVYQTSELTIRIPAKNGNRVPQLIHDSFRLKSEEAEQVLTFIKNYWEENYKKMVRDMIDSRSEIPIRPTI